MQFFFVRKKKFRPKFNSTTIDSSRDKSFLILMGREFLKNRPTTPSKKIVSILLNQLEYQYTYWNRCLRTIVVLVVGVMCAKIFHLMMRKVRK